MSNQSEVALLRARIDQEVEALQHVRHGFAQTASHEIISHHYRIIDVCFEELAAHLGEEAAIEAVCERINELR
jgi:hypothetical protein